MTGMYNVVAKPRSGEALTPKECAVHEIAACGILRDMHDELDALVAEAYGWPWPMTDAEILDRLVALHNVRVAEEAQGIVRWLRPEFQVPDMVTSAPPAELALTASIALPAMAVAPVPWPAEAIEQLVAAGILLPITTGRRNRWWEAAGLMDIIARLDAGLPPDETDTATPNPAPA